VAIGRINKLPLLLLLLLLLSLPPLLLLLLPTCTLLLGCWLPVPQSPPCDASTPQTRHHTHASATSQNVTAGMQQANTQESSRSSSRNPTGRGQQQPMPCSLLMLDQRMRWLTSHVISDMLQ
jgi:hypothetical protein